MHRVISSGNKNSREILQRANRRVMYKPKAYMCDTPDINKLEFNAVNKIR